jgi:hypothetical protein
MAMSESEPGEIQFVCIGCGAMNPAGAEVCAGCGHRFAGPDLMSATRPIMAPRPRPAPLLNPYEPPSTPISVPRTFQIGTGLVYIAVIAVCLGAFRADVSLGVASVVLLMPATIRTSMAAGRRRSEGRPMGFGEQVETFMLTGLATVGVAISSVIAFVVTCFPSGLATGNIVVALVIGAAGALVCAIWLTRVFLGIGRDNAAREREIRYR